MHKIKYFFTALIALASVAIHAQNNVFLDRAYWKSKPIVAVVTSEIAKGNNATQLNSNAFDATVYAILEDAPEETIHFLLDQKGNEVNKITHDGRTYIFWAAYKGNVKLMQYLFDKGAKTDLQDDHGYTPLNFAAANGQANTQVYDFMLSKGADLKKDLDHNGANALLLAASGDKDFTRINYFVAKGLDIKSTDANGNTAFNYAAKTGDIEHLKALLQKGVKPTDNAMIMASVGTRNASNLLELYTFLESLKIKPNTIGKNGENALHAIVRKEKQTEIINYFLSKGVDVNQPDNDGNTAFMNAAASANAETVELLSKSLKDINQKNKKGASALALAIKSNFPEVVQLLLQKGADVNTEDANGDNLAAYMIQSYSLPKSDAFEVKLKAIQAKGFNFATPQKNENTLYHLAIAKNELSLFKRLEIFKIDINAKNKEGMTVLHKAAMTAQDDKILKYLVKLGAKKQLTTEFKETAFDLASENESLTKNNIAIDFLK